MFVTRYVLLFHSKCEFIKNGCYGTLVVSSLPSSYFIDKKNSINPFYVFHLSPSLPSRVQISPSFMNVPLLLLSVLLPPLVSVLLSLPLSSHPSFLDTSRVM